MEISVFFAGSGGQGVMRVGKLLGHSASVQGKNAVYFPSYGTEMRGGMANCSVIVSDEVIYSPVRDQYDILVAFNQTAYDAFKQTLKPDGILIANTSLVKNYELQADNRVLEVDTMKLCAENDIGNSANIVLLGAFAYASAAIDPEALRQTISEEFPESSPAREKNLKAYDVGVSLASLHF